MTIKELRKQCRAKSYKAIVCFLIFAAISCGVYLAGGRKYILVALAGCIGMAVVGIVSVFKEQREYNFYQSSYDLKEIEFQLAAEETIAVPEKQLYFTRDYILYNGGGFRIVKKNRVLVVKEKVMTTSTLKQYFFNAYLTQGEEIQLTFVIVKRGASEDELFQAREAIKKAFPNR